MFSVGDKIVHPMHGAGVIESIVEEKISGNRMQFYVFRMPVSGLVLKIPTDNASAIGVRRVSTADEIRALLEQVPALDASMTVNWNHRYQENMQLLKSGRLIDVARVIKGLMLRDRERGLSTGERKMLHGAKQVLLSEMVLSENIEYAAAEEQLNSVMLG